MRMPATGDATWRAMAETDLPAVATLADAIHVDHPEDGAVFAERLALFPAGCLVLESSGVVAGYVVAHPGRVLAPPALNARIGALPSEADCLYLHDIALAPSARGRGLAAVALERLVAVARAAGLPRIALVAVAGTGRFWTQHGFEPVDAPALAPKLATYDSEARLMLRRLD